MANLNPAPPNQTNEDVSSPHSFAIELGGDEEMKKEGDRIEFHSFQFIVHRCENERGREGGREGYLE